METGHVPYRAQLSETKKGSLELAQDGRRSQGLALALLGSPDCSEQLQKEPSTLQSADTITLAAQQNPCGSRRISLLMDQPCRGRLSSLFAMASRSITRTGIHSKNISSNG